MKKTLAILLALLMALSLFSACTTDPTPSGDGTDSGSGTTAEETDPETPTTEESTTEESTTEGVTTDEDPDPQPEPDVDVASALKLTLSTDKTSYKTGDSIVLTVKILNQTKIDQTNLTVGVSTPAGVAAGDGASFTVETIAAEQTVEKTVTLTANATAAAVSAKPNVTRAEGTWYSDYSKLCKIKVDGTLCEISVDAVLPVTARASLTGKVGMTTLNTKGSKFMADNIVITSNSDGSVIYSNDFEGENALADFTYTEFYGNLSADYNLTSCWSVVEKDGSKVLSLEPGSDFYGMAILFGNLKMCDYTFSFKLLDDGEGQLMRPLFGVYGGEKGVANGYQWVMGGWSNQKTVLQQYIEKADQSGSTRIQPIDPEYATFSNTEWIQVDIVVHADRVECYVDGVLYLTYSPEA